MSRRRQSAGHDQAAALAVPHLPVDVGALGCDFYAFSGHKVFGPTGIGVLWGRARLLEAMPPWQGGGEMVASVDLASGTLSVAAASLLATQLRGAALADARALLERFCAFVTEPPGAPMPELGELTAFAGVREFKSRRACATLPALAFLRALAA